MTPPPPPPPRRRSDELTDDAELVDLLASLALDDLAPDEATLADARRRGVSHAQVLARRDELAIARRSLLLGAVGSGADRLDPDATDRAVEAAMERAALDEEASTPVPQGSSGHAVDIGSAPSARSSTRAGRRRRLAPVLVAASVVAVAGIGVLALDGSSGPGEDLASTDDAASTTAASAFATRESTGSTDAGDAQDSATAPSVGPAAGDLVGPDDAAESLGADEGTAAELLDLGAVQDLAAAYAALDRPLQRTGGTPPTSTASTDEVDECSRALGAQRGRAVALITVAGVDHVALSDGSEVVLVRLVDCTVAPRP